MQLAESKKRFSLPFHVVKKLDISKTKYWIIKVSGILVAFLLAGLICTLLKPGTFTTFYSQMILGCFSLTAGKINDFLITFALLTLVAFALAPAFKMKFWNIGGEGQILVGCLTTAGIAKFMPASGAPDWVIIIVSLVAAVAAGIIWGVIPAICKAFFGTNETLFTLMMNYVAAGLILLFINLWVPNGSQIFGLLERGYLPEIFNFKYLLSTIIAFVLVILVTIYLKKTKHGYELSVVGESVNTARYVGINVKKVTIRTMVLSAGLCGFVGFLFVSGYHHSLNSTLSGGIGFTGVLIAWLGSFEPILMVLYAFLVAVFQRGSINAASYVNMNTDHFSAIVTGMFFLVVIATEFFVNYSIMLKKNSNEKKDNSLQLQTVPSYEEIGDVVEEATLEAKPVPAKKPVKKEVKVTKAEAKKPVKKTASKPVEKVAKENKTTTKKPTKATPAKTKPSSSKSKMEAK